MKRLISLCCIQVFVLAANADSILDQQHPGSLSSAEGAVGSFYNPAAAGFDPHSAELEYFGSLEDDGDLRSADWGFYGKLGTLAIGAKHQEYVGGQYVNQFRVGMGYGDRDNHSGWAYVWNKGNLVGGDGPDQFIMSSMHRFAPFGRQMPQFSLGEVHHFLLGNDNANRNFHRNSYYGEGGLSVRPLPALKGFKTLSLFADATWNHQFEFHGDRVWVGAQWSPLNYLKVGARKNMNFEDFAFTADIQLGSFGVGYLGSEEEAAAGLDNPSNSMVHVHMNSSLFNKVPQFRPSRLTYAHLELKGLAGEYSWLISGASFRLPDFLAEMDAIQNDPRVKGIFIEQNSSFSADPTVLWEIRRRLEEFKESGGEVVYYSHSLSFGSLYLASVADRRAILPIGEAQIMPFGSERLYFKGALNKAGIEYTRWNIGAYKGAGEPFAADHMSDEVRENVGRTLREIRSHMEAKIKSGYGLSSTEMETLMHGYFHHADALHEMGLIDTLVYDDAVENWVCHRSDEGDDSDKKGIPLSFNFGSAGHKEHLVALSALRPEMARRQWMDDREIAVIYASGPIREGTSIGPFVIGHKTVIKQLKAARKNDRIKAVVFHVDSPGGSGYASDLVWRELELLKKEKPLVVTQGFLAASGGYYFSMNADEIITTPVTITGSIGVAAGMFFDKGLMENSGFTQDGVWAGKRPFGGAMMPFGINLDAGNASLRLPTLPVLGRPLNTQQNEEIQGLIYHFYEDFVQKVADGRDMDWDNVHAMAEGRVWSGPTAIEKDLADSIGGLSEAIELARTKADLPKDSKVQEYYPEFSLSQLFELMGGMATLQLDETKTKMSETAMEQARQEQLELLGSQRPEVLFDYFLFSPFSVLN